MNKTIYLLIIASLMYADDFNLRSMMKYVESTINTEYQVDLKLDYDDNYIFVSSEDSKKYNLSIHGANVIELWAYGFKVKKDGDNKKIEDSWLVIFRKGMWNSVKYNTKTETLNEKENYWTVEEKQMDNNKISEQDYILCIEAVS